MLNRFLDKPDVDAKGIWQHEGTQRDELPGEQESNF